MAVSRQVTPRRAVFLDKDGTLIENVPYNIDVERIRFTAGAEQAVPRLAGAGFAIAIVSDPPGVARGVFDEAAVAEVGRALPDKRANPRVGLARLHYRPRAPAGAGARPPR